MIEILSTKLIILPIHYSLPCGWISLNKPSMTLISWTSRFLATLHPQTIPVNVLPGARSHAKLAGESIYQSHFTLRLPLQNANLASPINGWVGCGKRIEELGGDTSSSQNGKNYQINHLRPCNLFVSCKSTITFHFILDLSRQAGL